MTNDPILSAVEMHPSIPATASIIWMHGLGADGHDFVDIIPELHLPEELGVRFVFPHAPHQPVTINGGYAMRAWYDIFADQESHGEDDAGIRASEAAIRALIQSEINKGVLPSRIVLAGFSQGGAVALHTGLRYPQRLAGILALSTYLPLAGHLRADAHPANADVPIMMAHGSEDTVIPIKYAQYSCATLTECGYHVAWHEYAMPHALCPEEIDDIGAWLCTVLSDAAHPARADAG